jgi:hypothetical protein
MVEDLDKKLFRRAINFLLDGFTLEIQQGVYLRYYRRHTIIENGDWEQETLDNGIFQQFEASDARGKYTSWMKMVELDDVDYFFKDMSNEEKEELYITMCASMVLTKSKRR